MNLQEDEIMLTPAQQLGLRHQRWLEEQEIAANRPLSWLEYKNLMALSSWRKRYERAVLRGASRTDIERRTGNADGVYETA